MFFNEELSFSGVGSRKLSYKKEEEVGERGSECSLGAPPLRCVQQGPAHKLQALPTPFRTQRESNKTATEVTSYTFVCVYARHHSKVVVFNFS